MNIENEEDPKVRADREDLEDKLTELDVVLETEAA